MKKARFLAVLLAASCAAAAADREFDDVVKAIETHFSTTRVHIPLMGVANFFLKVAHPAGTSGFRLAIFENLQWSEDGHEQVQLDRFMNGLASPALHPLIRTHSRPNLESTYVYVGEPQKYTRFLVTVFSRNNATVVELKANVETLLRWIQSPELAGKELNLDHHDKDNDDRDER
jgi:hypothetical protein